MMCSVVETQTFLKGWPPSPGGLTVRWALDQGPRDSLSCSLSSSSAHPAFSPAHSTCSPTHLLLWLHTPAALPTQSSAGGPAHPVCSPTHMKPRPRPLAATPTSAGGLAHPTAALLSLASGPQTPHLGSPVLNLPVDGDLGKGRHAHSALPSRQRPFSAFPSGCGGPCHPRQPAVQGLGRARSSASWAGSPHLSRALQRLHLLTLSSGPSVAQKTSGHPINFPTSLNPPPVAPQVPTTRLGKSCRAREEEGAGTDTTEVQETW